MELESEEELKEYLKQIFASEKTRSLVATLLQQVAN
jgi:DNA-binding phage protein